MPQVPINKTSSASGYELESRARAFTLPTAGQTAGLSVTATGKSACAAQTCSLASYRHSGTELLLKSSDTSADKKDEGESKAETRACQAFEAFMIGEMMKSMRGDAVGGRGILPISRAESIYVRQQCETLGQVMAEREPLGIASLMRQTLNRNGGEVHEDRKHYYQQHQSNSSHATNATHQPTGVSVNPGIAESLLDGSPHDDSPAGIPGASGYAGTEGAGG